MVVHFDFILSDIDAENLMQWLNGEINRTYELIQEAIVNRNKIELKNHKQHIKYVNKVIDKIKNTKCDHMRIRKR